MRITCPSCKCEIVTMDKTLAYVVETNQVWEPVDEWEPARVTEDCPCRCHVTAKAFLKNHYE